MASSEAPADFIASRKQASCCAGSPSVHFRRISDSCSGVGVHTDFALIREAMPAPEAAALSGRADGTNQWKVAQHNARAVKIAGRVILFVLVISSGYFLLAASRTLQSCGRLAPLELLGTAAGHEDPRGRREVHIFLLGADSNAAHLAILLFAARRFKLQPVLIIQHHIQLLEEWRERNWRLQALEERFAARPVRHFGEVALPVVHLKHIAAEPAYAAGVQRVNHDAGLLGTLNCSVHIGTERIAAEAIDAVSNQENLTARAGDRPTLDQIHN